MNNTTILNASSLSEDDENQIQRQSSYHGNQLGVYKRSKAETPVLETMSWDYASANDMSSGTVRYLNQQKDDSYLLHGSSFGDNFYGNQRTSTLNSGNGYFEKMPNSQMGNSSYNSYNTQIAPSCNDVNNSGVYSTDSNNSSLELSKHRIRLQEIDSQLLELDKQLTDCNKSKTSTKTLGSHYTSRQNHTSQNGDGDHSLTTYNDQSLHTSHLNEHRLAQSLPLQTYEYTQSRTAYMPNMDNSNQVPQIMSVDDLKESTGCQTSPDICKTSKNAQTSPIRQLSSSTLRSYDLDIGAKSMGRTPFKSGNMDKQSNSRMRLAEIQYNEPKQNYDQTLKSGTSLVKGNPVTAVGTYPATSTGVYPLTAATKYDSVSGNPATHDLYPAPNSYPYTSSDSEDDDLDSLLNRSLELQSHIKVSHDETEAYEPLSPTGKKYLGMYSGRRVSRRTRAHSSEHYMASSPVGPRTYSPNFTRTQSHSIDQMVGQLDLDNSLFTIQSIKANMEDSYTIQLDDSNSSNHFTSPQRYHKKYDDIPSRDDNYLESKYKRSPGMEKMSSALWAMRLIELLHNADPLTRQNIILKARWFRRWLTNVRCIRTDRLHHEHMQNMAKEVRRQQLLAHYFYLWRAKARRTRVLEALALYRLNALRKGFDGLKWAVQKTKALYESLDQERQHVLKEKFFYMWKEKTEKRHQVILRSTFDRWQHFKLAMQRERLLEGAANKLVLSRAYCQWKDLYKTQQKYSMAALHHKVSMLTKGWQAWRAYTMQAIVHKRQKEVARVNYINNLTTKTFCQMKTVFEKHQIAKEHCRCQLLHRVLLSWKQNVWISKAERVRDHSRSIEFRKKALLQSCWVQWSHRLLMQRAENHAKHITLSKALEMWVLRWRRNTIQRQRQEAQLCLRLKQGALATWNHYVQDRRTARERGICLLKRAHIRGLLRRWSEYTKIRNIQRCKMEEFQAKMRQRQKSVALATWVSHLHLLMDRQKAQQYWSMACARKAAHRWHTVVHIRRLNDLLVSTQPHRDTNTLRVYFGKWLSAKHQCERQYQRAIDAERGMQCTTMRNIFTKWRIQTQQALTIKPIRTRVNRKLTARVFDAWREVHTRKQRLQKLAEEHQNQTTRNIFFIWREKYQMKQKERKVAIAIVRGCATRCLYAWKSVVERRHMCEDFKAHSLSLVLKRAFSVWRNRLAYKEMVKFELEAKKTYRFNLMHKYFNRWRANANTVKVEVREFLDRLDRAKNEHLVHSTFETWKRQLVGSRIASEHQRVVASRRLRDIIQSWHQYTRAMYSDSVQTFSSALCNASLQLTPSKSSENSHLSDRSHMTLVTQIEKSQYSPASTIAPSASSPTNSEESSISHITSVSSSGFHSNGFQSNTDRRFSSNGSHGILAQHSNGGSSGIDSMHAPSPIHGSFSSLTKHNFYPLDRLSPLSDYAAENDTYSNVFSTPRSTNSNKSLSLGCRQSLDRRLSYERSYALEKVCLETEKLSLGSSSFSDPFLINIENNNKNVKNIMIYTINRWCNWPVSATFYQWLEYVRWRRDMRLMREDFEEQRKVTYLAKTLRQWKYQYKACVLAREHRNTVLLKKGLDGLRQYLAWRQMKTHDTLKAIDQHRYFTLTTTFYTWKQKLAEKEKCGRVLDVWQHITSFNTNITKLGDHFQQQLNIKTMRQCWHAWIMRSTQMSEVKRYYIHTLRKRIFQAWSTYVAERVQRREQARDFMERSTKQRMLNLWRRRLSQKCQVDVMFVESWRNRMSDILQRWRYWSAECKARRKVGEVLRLKFDMRSLALGFQLWRQEAHKLQRLRQIYEQNLLARCLRGWRNTVLEDKENEMKLQLFHRHHNSRRLAGAFCHWFHVYATQKQARDHHDALLQQQVAQIATYWHQKTLASRAVRFHNALLKTKVFCIWQAALNEQRNLRILVLKMGNLWREKTELCKVQRLEADEFRKIQETMATKRLFKMWCNNTKKVEDAKHHFQDQIISKCFRGWRDFTLRKHTLKEKQKELLKQRHLKQLSVSYGIWKNEYLLAERRETLLRGHLLMRSKVNVQVKFTAWRDCCHDTKATNHHNRQLVGKVLRAWCIWTRNQYDRKMRQAALERALNECTIRTALQQWKHEYNLRQLVNKHYQSTLQTRVIQLWHGFIVKKKKLNLLRNVCIAKHDQSLMKQALTTWKSKHEICIVHAGLSQEIKHRHNKRLISKYFITWREHYRENLAVKHYSKVVLARMFNAWCVYLKDLKETRRMDHDLAELAQHHYEQKQCKLVLQAWYNEVLVTRQQEKRQQKLMLKYGTLWKRRVDMAHTARQVYVYKVYRKIWRIWRHIFIQHKTVAHMTLQENKELISTIFNKWRHLASIEHVSKNVQDQRCADELRLRFNYWMDQMSSYDNLNGTNSTGISISVMSDQSHYGNP
ncbi:unnamed protein product [Owenia fusiformis]|nr:unnamed protein product [Owenia fusiformis]